MVASWKTPASGVNITKETSWHAEADSLHGWEQGSPEPIGAEEKKREGIYLFFFFQQSLFFFQITDQVKRMLDYLNLVGCGLWAGFGWGSTGGTATAFFSVCEEPLLSLQWVLDSDSFWRRKKEARTVALCVSQRQHCFLGLAQPTDNVPPFMRDCFTAPTHGMPGASLHVGERGWMPPCDARTTHRAANGDHLLMMTVDNPSSSSPRVPGEQVSGCASCYLTHFGLLLPRGQYWSWP